MSSNMVYNTFLHIYIWFQVIQFVILTTAMVNAGVIDPCATNRYAYPNDNGPYNQADLSLLGQPAHHLDKRTAKSSPFANPQYTFDSRNTGPQYLPCKMLMSLKTIRNYN